MSATANQGAPAEFNQDVYTLAEVYADAMLAAADAQGQGEEIAAEFADLIAYMDGDPDFAAFLMAESVDDDARRTTLEKLFRGRMSELLLNTLLVMNNRGRMGLMRAVGRVAQLRMERRHHQQEVTVETAVPLGDELRAQIAQAIGERIGKEALLIEKVRPELIGGLVLHVGDTQIDASVTTRLRLIRKRLSGRASVEIHSGRGYTVDAQA